MSIGKRIREARISKGFTQEYLAEKLNISRQAVSKWEKDQTNPDTGNLIALAGLLDTSVEYLATGNQSEYVEPQRNYGTIFRIASLIPLFVMFLCWTIGLLSGEYTDMVMIPLSAGGVGIPFLLYGESPTAIMLLVVSIVSFLLFILLLFLGYYMDKNKK